MLISKLFKDISSYYRLFFFFPILMIFNRLIHYAVVMYLRILILAIKSCLIIYQNDFGFFLIQNLTQSLLNDRQQEDNYSHVFLCGVCIRPQDERREKLGGYIARTADPNRPKGYSVLYDVMFSIYFGGRWPGKPLLHDGLNIENWMMSNCIVHHPFCIFCCCCCYYYSLSVLLNYLYLNP